MQRRAFAIRLRPGALAEYRRRHEEMWPELVTEIERCGIGRLCAFEADPLVFYYSEVADEEAWARLEASDVHRRWGETFDGLLDTEAGVEELPELYCLDTAGGRS